MKIFSGIRPSGKLHLGNYLGAIRNWIELQNGSNVEQCIYAVVDLHGITTPYDPNTYPQQVTDAVLDFLAAGVDPKKSLLIRQSHVPQHTELTWLFSTITPLGWLERLPTYKEKLEQVKIKGLSSTERSGSAALEMRDPNKAARVAIDRHLGYQNNTGLLMYPVLMAADILLYKSNLVPVGEDQLAHIDLTNEIAKKFNGMFGQTFEPVKAHLTKGARVMSLQDPTKKMSKTGDEGIALSDDPDAIRAKIKKAVTDSGKEVKYDEVGKPAISNLLTMYSLLGNKSIADLETAYQGKSYVDFKNDLAEVVVEFLKPFQAKHKELESNPIRVREILEKSEETAQKIARKNLQEIREKMGL